MAIKYPHLNNEDIIKMIDTIRVIQFANYPDEFKNKNVPHGHDLLEEIKERLHLTNHALENEFNHTCIINLTYLFKHNHDLMQYIHEAIDEACDRGLSFPPNMVSVIDKIPDILRSIEKNNLIARVAQEGFTLFVAPNVREELTELDIVDIDDNEFWAIVYSN